MVKHIFYHNDPDGWCSAAVILRYSTAPGRLQLHPVDYDRPFDWSVIDKGHDIIYVVDYCLQPFSDMLTLLDEARNLIWIDHHKSAIEAWRQHGGNIDIAGTREIGRAACEQCWSWTLPDLPMPQTVRLLGRYDVWDQECFPQALHMMLGLKTLPGCERPDAEIWDRLVGTQPSETNAIAVELMNRGRHVDRYLDTVYREICGRSAAEVIFAGRRCIACNAPLRSSDVFRSVYDPEKHYCMLLYYRNQAGRCCVSLYSTREDVDCAELAGRYGGGGHKGAAGFVCDELPFVLDGKGGL